MGGQQAEPLNGGLETEPPAGCRDRGQRVRLPESPQLGPGTMVSGSGSLRVPAESRDPGQRVRLPESRQLGPVTLVSGSGSLRSASWVQRPWSAGLAP